MSDPLETWWVYEMNDCDCVVARSLEEAKSWYIDETGAHEDDVEEARRLTAGEMRTRMITLSKWGGWDAPEHQWKETFMDHFLGQTYRVPELFSSTEF